MEGRERKAVIDNVCLNPCQLGLWAGNSNNNGNITAEKSCLTSAISLLISQLLWDFRKRFGVSFEQSTSFPSQMLCFCSWGEEGCLRVCCCLKYIYSTKWTLSRVLELKMTEKTFTVMVVCKTDLMTL